MPEDVWLEGEVSVPWPDDRCILCLNGFTEDKRQCRTREHVIPVSLGGELLVDFLCKHCNNKLGTVVDSQLREETRLRFRLGVNPAQIPKVFESATNSLEFRGRAGGDSLDLKRRDCKYVPLTSQPDGSMIVRSDADSGFIQHLNRRLHPEALPQAPIVRVTPDNRALPLPPVFRSMAQTRSPCDKLDGRRRTDRAWSGNGAPQDSLRIPRPSHRGADLRPEAGGRAPGIADQHPSLMRRKDR